MSLHLSSFSLQLVVFTITIDNAILCIYSFYCFQLVNTAPFTVNERNMIVQLYRNHGPKWRRIASQLHGRTPRMVKNLWYSMQRAEVNRIRRKMSVRRLLN